MFFLFRKGSALPVAASVLLLLLPVAAAGMTPQQEPALHQRGDAVVPYVEQQAPLSEWQSSQMAEWARDFAGLDRYRAANQQLADPASDEHRVVFFGDTITDKWDLAHYFPGKDYINRGISGQTTSQMLLRFREDVLNLKPDVVVILAGSNDIAGYTGRISLQEIEGNIASMAELARVHNVALVLSSVTPVNNYTPGSQAYFAARPPSEILRLNAWLKAYCNDINCYYVNYFDAMVDGSGLLRRSLSDDGLHPNDAGYKIMAPLAESAIDKTMASR